MQSSEKELPPGLKPALISLGLRGPEGPLFHGDPHIRGFPHIHGDPHIFEFFRKL